MSSNLSLLHEEFSFWIVRNPCKPYQMSEPVPMYFLSVPCNTRPEDRPLRIGFSVDYYTLFDAKMQYILSNLPHKYTQQNLLNCYTCNKYGRKSTNHFYQWASNDNKDL